MNQYHKPGDHLNTLRRGLASLCAALGLGLATLSGCNSTPKQHTGDPLMGEPIQPKGPNGQPLPPVNIPAKQTSALPYPESNSASSNAAIAANTGAPYGTTLAGGRDLAIGDGTRPSWIINTGQQNYQGPIVQPVPRDTSAPAGNNPFGVVPNNTPSNNIFGAPPTAAAPNTTSPTIATASWTADNPLSRGTAPSGPVAPLGTTTTDVLVSTLQGKGAIGLRQENVLEGVRVSCYVPSRTNSQDLRHLETTARDYPTALQAILQQIDQ